MSYSRSAKELPERSFPYYLTGSKFVDFLFQLNAFGYLREKALDIKFFNERLSAGETWPSNQGKKEKKLQRKLAFESAYNLGHFDPQFDATSKELLKASFDAFSVIHKKAKQLGARMIIVYHPQRFSVNQQDRKRLQVQWQLPKKTFNWEQGEKRFLKLCETQALECVSLLENLQSSAKYKNLYLPNNVHMNRFGHETAAMTLNEYLLKGSENANR